jgi:hypothetical protein
VWYLVFRQDGALAWAAPDRNPNPPAEDSFTVLPVDVYDRSKVYSCANGALVVTTPDPLIAARAATLGSAQSFYDGLFALPKGFTFSGKLYQMDDDSRANWVILGVGADRSAADPTSFPWTDIPVVAADNSTVPMDVPTARRFSQATIGYWAACRPVFRAIKDAIAAATDQAALDAIDVTAGYPAASA